MNRLFAVVCVLVAILASVVCSTPTPIEPITAKGVRKLMLNSLIDLRLWADAMMAEHQLAWDPSPDYPYWNMLPQYLDSFPSSGSQIHWESRCWAKNVGYMVLGADGRSLEVTINSVGHRAENCTDAYITFTATSTEAFIVKSGRVDRPAVTTHVSVKVPETLTEAAQWYFDTKGLQLFSFANDAATTFSNLITTIETLLPEFNAHVPAEIAALNRDFMAKYPQVIINPRDKSVNNPPDESEVHSGDFFGVMRLDGLNPLLAWAMGSTTGHTTTALWVDGELYVCESTITSEYWPYDGIQKTPYREWLQLADAADYQVVWAPLTAEARVSYNETAAVEFFKANEGFDYGFKTMIWGWIDTPDDNFPCLPPYPATENCMSWAMFEPLLAFLDYHLPPIGYMMWNAGVAMRLNVTDTLRTVDYYKIAGDRGLDLHNDVISIPEEDTWMYNTTRYGEAAVGKDMVCCVFVCNMWKAAGVFGDIASEINCGELTNWDDVSPFIAFC
jgi:hypothetical protein